MLPSKGLLDADTRAALGSRPVLTAGSTHAGEDEALIHQESVRWLRQ